MLTAFLAGVVAGYAIAIPVGAIAVLIVELGLRQGFRVAAAGGAGAATADTLYAALAVTAGSLAAVALAPFQAPLRWIAVIALVAIAVRGIVRGLRSSDRPPATTRQSATATYLRFVALTVLNPTTIVYFAALILGLGPAADGAAERGAFVAGVALASLSWQTLLAGIGAIGHRRLPARAQATISLLGNLTILGLALVIALGSA